MGFRRSVLGTENNACKMPGPLPGLSWDCQGCQSLLWSIVPGDSTHYTVIQFSTQEMSKNKQGSGKSHGRRSLVGCSPWVVKSQTRLSDFTFTFHFHVLEKEMATHSSVLGWRIPGMVEPGGLPSMGWHRVGHDWSNSSSSRAENPLSEKSWLARKTSISQLRVCHWRSPWGRHPQWM